MEYIVTIDVYVEADRGDRLSAWKKGDELAQKIGGYVVKVSEWDKVDE